MSDAFEAKGLLDLSQISGGVVAAFVLVGALSLVILQVYTAIPGRNGNRENESGNGTAQDNMRAVRESELSVANGEDGCPVYVAVADPYSNRVTVFDMDTGREFYGPGGPYHLFAGRNATVGLAKSSLSSADMDGDMASLTASEQDTHAQWYAKFNSKYPVVGYLIRDGDVDSAEELSSATSQDAKKNE